MSVFTNFLASVYTKIVLFNGAELPRRKTINYIGGTVVDNPAADRTDVTFPGAASGQANTNTNAGSGVGQLAKTKVGVDTPIKSIAKATDDLISVANGTNEVTLSIPNVKRGNGDPNGSLAGSQGDLFIRTDTAKLYQNTDGATAWSEAGTNLGDVVGPASATNDALARFDTATGKLIQDSNATLSDAGTLTIARFLLGRQFQRINPPAVAAQQNNWAPTGWNTADVVEVLLTGDQTVSGFLAPTSGGVNRKLIVNKDTTDTLTIPHLNSSSGATAQVRTPGNTPYHLGPGESVFIDYETDAWRLIGAISDTIIVDTVADLRALPYLAASKAKLIMTLGTITAGDQGGVGEWTYSASTTRPDDTGTIVHFADGPGTECAVRVNRSNIIHLAWFTGPFTGEDNTVAWEAMMDWWGNRSGYSWIDSTSKPPEIQLPRGIITLDMDSPFTSQAAVGVAGGLFRGRGYNSTTINLLSDVTDRYFYDSTGLDKIQFVQFEDIGFTSDDVTMVGGFIIEGGHEQSFRFNKCQFKQIKDVISCTGSLNASEISINDCMIIQCDGPVMTLNNGQAVGCRVINTDVVIQDGPALRVTGLGGGKFVWENGSFIQHAGATVEIETGTNIGRNTGNFHFSGVQFEYHNTATVFKQTAEAYSIVTFENCNLNPFVGTARTMIEAHIGQELRFINCRADGFNESWLIEQDTSSASVGNAGLTDPFGKIYFDGCVVEERFHDSWVPIGSYYHIQVRGCVIPLGTHWDAETSAAGIAGNRVQVFADWDNTGASLKGAGSRTLFEYRLFTGEATDTHGTGFPRTAILPPNVEITHLYIARDAANNGTFEDYEVKIFQGDDLVTPFISGGLSLEDVPQSVDYQSASGEFQTGTSNTSRMLVIMADPDGAPIVHNPISLRGYVQYREKV